MSNPYPGQITSKRIVVFLRCTCGFNGLAALNGSCPNCGTSVLAVPQDGDSDVTPPGS
ncbi:MAG TPA: hypothetical protein VI455_02970 [Terriglobia bacterium]